VVSSCTPSPHLKRWCLVCIAPTLSGVETKKKTQTSLCHFSGNEASCTPNMKVSTQIFRPINFVHLANQTGGILHSPRTPTQGGSSSSTLVMTTSLIETWLWSIDLGYLSFQLIKISRNFGSRIMEYKFPGRLSDNYLGKTDEVVPVLCQIGRTRQFNSFSGLCYWDWDGETLINFLLVTVNWKISSNGSLLFEQARVLMCYLALLPHVRTNEILF